MSAQAGRDMLVKIKNASNNFITLAGLRTRGLRLNTRPVDITHSESLEGWRELLPGAGIRTAEISGSGIFVDSEADALARQAFFEQSANDYRFQIPDFGQIEGVFLITALSYAGSYKGEATYDLTLTSAGALSFTAL